MGKLWQMFLSIFKSTWFKAFLMVAVDKLKQILEKIGPEAYAKIKAKIITVKDMNVPGTQKIKIVADYVRSLIPEKLSDSAINYLIESIVQDLQDKKAI